MGEEPASNKRGYDLRKRLENMDQTRLAVLQSARRQLETEDYRKLTMSSLAADSGVTRQTIHNLFGSKGGVLEAVFDSIALDGGMERMREVMHQSDPHAMLKAFVEVFCRFWENNRALFRRIHGIGAIDSDLGQILRARNERRHGIATRIARNWKKGREASVAAGALTALTSFEFYDALAFCGQTTAEIEGAVVELSVAALDAKRS